MKFIELFIDIWIWHKKNDKYYFRINLSLPILARVSKLPLNHLQNADIICKGAQLVFLRMQQKTLGLEKRSARCKSGDVHQGKQSTQHRVNGDRGFEVTTLPTQRGPERFAGDLI
jgi:hypothetical protein